MTGDEVGKWTADVKKAVRALKEIHATSSPGGPWRQGVAHALAVLEHPMIASAPGMVGLIHELIDTHRCPHDTGCDQCETGRALLARLDG